MKHSDALDSTLESLGSQVVPPDFHQSASADSSLFGSQHSDQDHEAAKSGEHTQNGNARSSVSRSPSSTLRNGLQNGKQKAKDQKPNPQTDRRSWKTLRDFVDDQAIEDVLETIENDRLRLEVHLSHHTTGRMLIAFDMQDIMGRTDEYPETLTTTINSIRESLPDLSLPPIDTVTQVLSAQDVISTSMAAHLESLTSHYGQMDNAFQESEAGEAFSEEDLHGTFPLPFPATSALCLRFKT